MAKLAAALAFAVGSQTIAGASVLDFSRDEIERILQHGPWPPPRLRDASNRVSGRAAAVDFGASLFFDPRLSTSGTISCASCHVPARAWSDRLPFAVGLDITERNAKTVLDARFNRWFGWGGTTDSLWAASLRPLLDAREMGVTEQHVARLVRTIPDLTCSYRAAFGRAPPADDETLFVDIGKALAAFQETLVSGRTAFDDFRDALARGEPTGAARYPLAAQRGLRLFVGRARCSTCHLGPRFTNQEFDKVGIPVRNASGRVDWGRYDGIKALRASRFNLLSRHNDDATRHKAISTQHVLLGREAYGAFKVPSLRNVARTAPYMHDGSIATLADVVRHYSEIDEAKLAIAAAAPHMEPDDSFVRPSAGSVLQTLKLSDAEITDLVAFLETLTEKSPVAAPPTRKPLGC